MHQQMTPPFLKFSYRNYKNYKHYAKICPVSHQPARLHITAKRQKIKQPQDIARDNIKFWPIIASTGTCT